MNEPEPVEISKYRLLKNINFSRTQEYNEPIKETLSLTFCDDVFSGPEQTVEFYDPDIKTLYWAFLGDVFLSAYDISGRGYERIKYHITDLEESNISFYCSGYSEKE